MSTSPAPFLKPTSASYYFFQVRTVLSFRSVSNFFEKRHCAAVMPCIDGYFSYFGLLFWCELSVASSLRRLLSSDAPNGFVCFSYRGGCVCKGICKLKIAIKSHRDLNPAAAHRSPAPPRASAFPTVTSYLLHLFKFLCVFFTHTYQSAKNEKFCTTKISRYTVYNIRGLHEVGVGEIY